MTEKKDSFGSDFLGLLLKAHHDADDGSKISVDDVIDQCRQIYFAGQETTNGLLAWTVFLLALHTDWQEETRKEVLQLFDKRTPDHDGLSKLKTVRKSKNLTSSQKCMFSIKFEIKHFVFWFYY